jgi:hypothetical protein
VVAFIHRFGSILNLNIRLHMLVLDGAWRFANRRSHFQVAPAPCDSHIECLLARFFGRIICCLVRVGVMVMEAEQLYLDVNTASDEGLAGWQMRHCATVLPSEQGQPDTQAAVIRRFPCDSSSRPPPSPSGHNPGRY